MPQDSVLIASIEAALATLHRELPYANQTLMEAAPWETFAQGMVFKLYLGEIQKRGGGIGKGL